MWNRHGRPRPCRLPSRLCHFLWRQRIVTLLAHVNVFLQRLRFGQYHVNGHRLSNAVGNIDGIRAVRFDIPRCDLIQHSVSQEDSGVHVRAGRQPHRRPGHSDCGNILTVLKIDSVRSVVSPNFYDSPLLLLPLSRVVVRPLGGSHR